MTNLLWVTKCSKLAINEQARWTWWKFDPGYHFPKIITSWQGHKYRWNDVMSSTCFEQYNLPEFPRTLIFKSLKIILSNSKFSIFLIHKTPYMRKKDAFLLNHPLFSSNLGFFHRWDDWGQCDNDVVVTNELDTENNPHLLCN